MQSGLTARNRVGTQQTVVMGYVCLLWSFPYLISCQHLLISAATEHGDSSEVCVVKGVCCV